MNLRRTPLSAAVLAALAAPALQAQTAANDVTLPAVTVRGTSDQGYNPRETSTAAKVDAPLRDIPQTVNVITREQMRDRGMRSIEDVVKTIPGVGLSHGDGQRDQMVIRGFSALSDQFVDGIRDDGVYFRDLSNVEQVEVVKGPAAVLYGRGSSGGLVNRITKKPGIDHSEASLQIGRWQQRRGELDVARKVNDNVAFRLTGAVERSNSYRDQQFLDREAIAPSALVRFSPDTSLLLQADYLHDKRLTDFGIPSWQGRPIDVGPGTYYGSGDARHDDTVGAKVMSATATLEHRFNATWSIRNALRYYDFELNRHHTTAGAVSADGNLALYPSGFKVARSRGAIARNEHGIFNQTEVTQKTTLAGMKHQILYGVEVGQQDRRQLTRAGTAVPVDAYRPVSPPADPAWTVSAGTTNSGSADVAAGYLQDLVTLAEQWKALVGIRYDVLKQEVNAANIPGRTDKAWSPRAGLVYQPSENQSYYVSVSRSFQPSGDGFLLTTTNAIATPQRTTGKEVGAKFDLFGGKASATAALFNLERTNIMSSDPANPLVAIPVGTQRTNGLELSFSGELAEGWRLLAGYAYLDGKTTKSLNPELRGKDSTLTPKHSANLWLTKTITHDWLGGAGVNYVDARFADSANTTTLPGYTTVDAMLAYRYDKLTLQFNLYNLFDRRYMISSHGAVANSLMPGSPRTAMLTARYTF